MTQLYDRYLGVAVGRPARPTTASGSASRTSPTPSCGGRTNGAASGWWPSPARRLRQQLKGRGAPPAEIARADEVLDPEALTIGFARRFATYKRGTLLFRNLDRLAAIINNKDRPVQIVFAGKAHPKDHGGKELIAEILQFARRPEFRRRIVFIEDYDMNVARYLVQGVDVWLNNPRRPLEASGTSGMKAAANGGLNLSILDGWWCEGYDGDNGLAIGAGEEYTDLTYQDDVESRAIYDLLEQEIVPLFYTRSSRRPAARLAADDEAVDHDALPGVQHQPDGGGVHDDVLPAVGAALPAAGGRQPAAGGRSWRRGGASCSAAGGRSAFWASSRTAPTRCTSATDLEVKVARGPGRLQAGRRGGAAVPRPGGLRGRDPAAAHGADVAQRPSGERLDVGVHGRDPVQRQRPARLRGARPAAPRRPGQPVRAGAGDVGVSREAVKKFSGDPTGERGRHPPFGASIMKLKIILHKEAEGGYSVAVPALPGCYSQGETVEEAMANIREAAEGHLEALNEREPFAPEDRSADDVVREMDL